MAAVDPYLLLIKQNLDLASIYNSFGAPPDWQRKPGFTTLVQIILEQQVSLASAKASFDKLAKYGDTTPDGFLRLDDITLKSFGFSRQKIRYCRALAQAIIDGLELFQLHQQDDTSIRSELIKLPGIGDWTIDIYLLLALNRNDVWPVGDLALRIAIQEIKGLKTQPNLEEMYQLGEAYRPYRSYAAKLLWHYYLSRKSNQFIQP